MPLRESRSSPLGYADASTADATNGDVVVRPSQSDDGVLSNGSNKSSNSQHKLDRYGFILNMDSHGNIREDTSAAGAATTNGTKVHSDTSNINNNGGGGGKNNISGSSEGSSNATHNKNNNNNSSKTASAAAAQAAREDCLPSAAEIARTNRREHKWQVLLDDGNKQWHNNTLQNGGVGSGIGNKWAIRRRRPNLVKKRLRKGVPDSQRSAVWPVLCRVREKIQQNPGLYRELVETSVGFTGTLSTTTIQTTPTTTATTSSRSAATDKTTTANGWSRSSNGVVQGKPKESASDPGKNTAVAFNYSKSFKNIQETIERDIHRTFPRHSLFYDNKEDRETELLEGGAAGENEEDAHSTDTQDLQKGMCGVTEISSMIEELELAAPQQQATTSAGVDSSNGNGTAASSSTNNNVRMMMMIHTGNAYGDNVSFNKILQDAGGQARLRRVLKAYSTYDREIGYCQGMNFIAAMFLTLVTEEEAFWMLVCKSTFFYMCVCVCAYFSDKA